MVGSDAVDRSRNLGYNVEKVWSGWRSSKDGLVSVVLHRDIFWLGRQWTVTGYGIQAVDKKLNMKFDVEAERLWDDGLADRMRSESWFDADDFNEALGIARRRAREHPTTFQQLRTDEK